MTVKFKSLSLDELVMSFDEFVEYGKLASSNIIDGMPWSFSFKGYPVTHENDDCYIISSTSTLPNLTRMKFGDGSTEQFGSIRFVRGEFIHVSPTGELYVVFQ